MTETPKTCLLCDQPLDDSRPWQQSLDPGVGAHLDCLEAEQADDEERED